MIDLLHSLIMVEVDEPDRNYGLIELPPTAQEAMDTGYVVASGPGEYDENNRWIENPIKKGQRVLFARGSGTDIVLYEKKYLVITPMEVTGIIREPNEN